MEKWFKTEEGKKVNVIEHILDQIKKWSNVKIYIATDSQDHDGHTTCYATLIVFRYGQRGAHYIYRREKVPKIHDMYTRLYDEGVRTIETAQMIQQEIPISFEALEFDYNTIEKHASNRLINAIGGWSRGLGFKTVFKNSETDMVIASKAADHVCRREYQEKNI